MHSVDDVELFKEQDSAINAGAVDGILDTADKFAGSHRFGVLQFMKDAFSWLG